MYIGKSYHLGEFLVWTRRTIFRLLIIATIPTVLYQVFSVKWLSVPWPVVGLLGAATAFVVGFKNQQTYNRTWEARQIWGGAMTSSKCFAMMCRDFISEPERAKDIIYRHFAWLTAMRYQLRASRDWEAASKVYNKEYRKYFTVPEKETPIETELAKYISSEEIKSVLAKKNPATQLLSIQSQELSALTNEDLLEHFRFLEIYNMLCELASHQGKSERIKNFPYPRQYATINTFFVHLFCILLPFALLKEFNELNSDVTGILKGYMVWLVIPFSVLISWVYTSLDQVGESTENPFEGNSNDIPISQMSRSTEIDIREMLGETDLPPSMEVRNSIVM